MKFYFISESIISDKKKLLDKNPIEIANYFISSSNNNIQAALNRAVFWSNRITSDRKNSFQDKEKVRKVVDIIKSMIGKVSITGHHKDVFDQNKEIHFFKNNDQHDEKDRLKHARKLIISDAKKNGYKINEDHAYDMIKSVYDFTDSDYEVMRKIQSDPNFKYNEDEKDKLKLKSKYIEQFIKMSQKFSGNTIYRGLEFELYKSLKETYEKNMKIVKGFSELKEGEEVNMLGTSSWTSNKNERHVKESNIIFICNKPKNGVPVNHVSRYPKEDEVMYSKDARFIVKKVEVKKNKEGDITKIKIEVEENNI